MRTLILFTCLFGLCLESLSQMKSRYVNTVGLSFPIVYNNSQALFYRTGNPQYSKGHANSYGINLNHSRSIHKDLYATVGVGYFKQVFGIVRPVDVISYTEPLYHTIKYSYDNMLFYSGIGYRKVIDSEGFCLKSELTYQHLRSYQQRYLTNINRLSQTNRESWPLGSVLNLGVGVEEKLIKQFSIGIDVCVPIIVKWNDDDMFYRFDYSGGTQRIAKNIFSIGANLSLRLNL